MDRNTVAAKILGIIKNNTGIVVENEGSTFAEGGIDSLDAVEVFMTIEEEFDIKIPDADAGNLKTVGELIDYVAAKVA